MTTSPANFGESFHFLVYEIATRVQKDIGELQQKSGIQQIHSSHVKF